MTGEVEIIRFTGLGAERVELLDHGLLPEDRHGPRLHDLRHRFAIETLLSWYRAGIEVERRMPELSAYLGHVHVNDTYWYISAVTELLQLATLRLEQRGEVR